MNTVQLILLIVPAIATGVISVLSYKIKQWHDKRTLAEENHTKAIMEREKATNEALRALCRDRILQGYRYYKAHGGISTFDLETMTKLYEAYHGLGGNGTITAVYDKITALPIKEGVD